MRHHNFEEALSLERFACHLAWAAGDRNHAIALYGQKTRVSESLYTPLQTLEVALRNRIHTTISMRKGDEWFGNGAGILLLSHQPNQVADVVLK